MYKKYKFISLVPTDSEWWGANLHAFKKGDRFVWSLLLASAIKKRGLPPGLSIRTANIALTRSGFGFHFTEFDHRKPDDGWTKKEIAQLRAIARNPLIRRRGLKACCRKINKLAMTMQEKQKG